MITYVESDKKALVFSNRVYTYRQLIDSIGQVKLQNEVYYLVANSNFDFIIKLLACLYNKVPCVVLPLKFDDYRLHELQMNIQKNGLHDECALVLLTSGSAGKPKAVQISTENISANLVAISACLDFDEIESQCIHLPLSYSFGLIGQLLVGLYNNKTNYISQNIVQTFGYVRNNSIQMISGVPSQLIQLGGLLKDTEHSLSHLISAGAPLNLEKRKILLNKFPTSTIYNNYGQTELAPRALCMNSRDPLFLSEATGYPVKGIICEILDGELIISGPQVMLGYVVKDITKLKGRVLYSGDLASENNGLYFIHGRKDSLIKVAGERVNIDELESDIQRILNINELYLISVANNVIGNELHLYFLKNLEFKKDEILKTLKSKCKIAFSHQNIHFIDNFPVNSNGKINKFQLKKMLRS